MRTLYMNLQSTHWLLAHLMSFCFQTECILGLFETQFSVRFGSLCCKGGAHFVRKAMAWGWQGGGRTPHGDLWEDELQHEYYLWGYEQTVSIKALGKSQNNLSDFPNKQQSFWPGISFPKWLLIYNLRKKKLYGGKTNAAGHKVWECTCVCLYIFFLLHCFNINLLTPTGWPAIWLRPFKVGQKYTCWGKRLTLCEWRHVIPL